MGGNVVTTSEGETGTWDVKVAWSIASSTTFSFSASWRLSFSMPPNLRKHGTHDTEPSIQAQVSLTLQDES